MTADRVAPRLPWNDRAFGAIPLAPISIAAGLALTLLGLFLASVSATGDLAEFMAQEGRWWQDRDGRLAVLFVLLAAYLPAARRYETLGARRHMEELRSAIRWRPGQFESANAALEPGDPGSRRTAGLLAMLVIPLTALLVDRDPLLYFQKHYWDVTHFWTYTLAGTLCWNGGILVHAISRHTHCFSGLARGIPQVDLLNLATFKPFTRQAMLSALPGVVVLSFLALNVGDRGFLWAIGALGSVAVALTSASLLILMRGVRERIRDAKQLELARVNAAIRGDLAALADSPLAARAGDLGLGDALAWRAFVEGLPEWPFDAPMRTRFLLYVALPLGSWLGGALVERLLDAALG